VSLLDVFTAINAQITDALAPAPPPLFRFADTTKMNDSPPRIIYVPRSGPITGPQGQGGDGVRNPRPLWTRNIGMEVHLWGADFAATETLMNVLTQAIHSVLWGAYLMHSEDWNTAADTANKLGVVCVLQMTWKIPITRAPDTTAVVRTIPLTPEIQVVIP